MNLELFSPEADDNILPCDGIVQDFGLILNVEDSQKYLTYFLQHLAWQHDEVFLHGTHYITDRKVVWYGDENYQYHYSGLEKQAHVWNPTLFRLKAHIEKLTGQRFNSCLANLYEDGSQGVGWHSDDEPSLGTKAVIASLSFGTTRKFAFKHKWKNEKVEIMLQSGQLIVMKGFTQRYWKHMIAKSSKIVEPRINLTFRYFYASH